MTQVHKIFINGKFIDSGNEELIQVLNPATDQIII